MANGPEPVTGVVFLLVEDGDRAEDARGTVGVDAGLLPEWVSHCAQTGLEVLAGDLGHKAPVVAQYGVVGGDLAVVEPAFGGFDHAPEGQPLGDVPVQ